MSRPNKALDALAWFNVSGKEISGGDSEWRIDYWFRGNEYCIDGEPGESAQCLIVRAHEEYKERTKRKRQRDSSERSRFDALMDRGTP